MSVFRALFLVVIFSFPSAVTAAPLLSPLDEDACIDGGFIWVQKEHGCVELSPFAMGDWVHIASVYKDIPGPFKGRWNYLDTPLRISIAGEHSLAWVGSEGGVSPALLIWGIDKYSNEGVVIGATMGEGEPNFLLFVTAAEASASSTLEALQPLNLFKAEDHLVIFSKASGTHYFRRKAEPAYTVVGAGRPMTSACYTMFSTPADLSNCLLESPDQFEGVRSSLASVAILSRFQVLTGYDRYADCLNNDATCDLPSVLATAMADVIGATPFLVTQDNRTRFTGIVRAYSRLDAVFARKEAEIHAQTNSRISDFEFIYDSVSINGTETMARGLFDPDAKARHTRHVVEAMFEKAACVAASTVNLIGDPANKVGGLLGGACGGGSFARQVMDFLDSKGILRAAEEARSPTILQTKLYMKALVADYGNMQIQRMHRLRLLANNDYRIASMIVPNGLDPLFPDYNATPLKKVLWQDALANFGMLKPSFFAKEALLPDATALSASFCGQPGEVLTTVSPWLKTGDASDDFNDIPQFPSLFETSYEVAKWSVFAGRAVESRELSPAAAQDLAAHVTNAEAFDLLKNRMFSDTNMAAERGGRDSAASFGIHRTVTLKTSRRDAYAVIPYSLEPKDFTYGKFIIQSALNPVTDSPDAQYSYIVAAPLSHTICP